MATERTPSRVIRESVGSINLHIATFTEIDNTDTYVSGLTGVVGKWFNADDDPTVQVSGGVDVSESSGTFTFRAGEDDRTGKLTILTTQPE